MRQVRTSRKTGLGIRLALVVALTLVGREPLHATTCTVPGTYPTIQEAIDDSACTEIELAAQVYAESIRVPRSLTITGPAAGTTSIEGQVLVVGAGTLVSLTDLEVQNSCQPEAVSVAQGAQMEGTGVVVLRGAALPCPPVNSEIFFDGFETGNTSGWSSTQP